VWDFIGRPFVKRFVLCYRSVVCLSVCLSVLSVCPVCDVRALWPNGWTDQAPLPQRGTAPTQFSAHICCGQMAAWIKMTLGMELGLSPGDSVLDGNPALPCPKKGAEPPIFGTFLLWPNGCMHQDATCYGGRHQPRGLCDRWGPSLP